MRLSIEVTPEQHQRKRSVPFFGKEGAGEILLNKSPLNPTFSKGDVNVCTSTA